MALHTTTKQELIMNKNYWREYYRCKHEEAKAAYAAFIPYYIDGHKLNCHSSNLNWATKSENQQHATRTGLHPSRIKS